jgi:hypothetical protein
MHACDWPCARSAPAPDSQLFLRVLLNVKLQGREATVKRALDPGPGQPVCARSALLGSDCSSEQQQKEKIKQLVGIQS